MRNQAIHIYFVRIEQRLISFITQTVTELQKENI